MGPFLYPLVGALALLAGCYKQVVYESSLPPMEAQTVSGPPGGGMDPGYGYQDPGAYGTTYEGAAVDQNLTGTVTDAEIQTTLAPYGEWVEDPEYGWVWRPYATVVGADFTPYESCGQWVYTEFGWTWESCADWYWGWLAFHYGQWAYLDSGWCWVAGYDYSPAWVDWRYGGGHVGWRPTEPRGGRFRDHRDGRPSARPGSSGGGQGGPVVRDHRRNKTPWTWVRAARFEAKNVRDHVVRNPRIRFESTTPVSRPPIPARSQLAAASLMRPRIQARVDAMSSQNSGTRPGVRPSSPTTVRPTYPRGPSTYPRGPSTYQPGVGSTAQPPRGPSTYQPRGPSTYQPGTVHQPSRPAYRPTRPAPPIYRAPTRDPGRFTPPSSSPPSRGYSPPSRSYSPPSRSYSPPSAPSRSYSPPSRSYSPPSRSSSPPSRSYSPPSRSSSSSYSAPSRSSSSSSRSSSSSSSRGSSGGGRRR